MSDPDERFPVTGDLILVRELRREQCPRAAVQQAGDHLVRRSPA